MFRYPRWPTLDLCGTVHRNRLKLHLPTPRITQTYRYQPHVIPECMVSSWSQEFLGREVLALEV